MPTMTLDEAKAILSDTRVEYPDSTREVAQALVLDALRAAEDRCAHLNAKLDATHTNRCFHCEQTVTEATSARQASGHAPVVVKAGDYPNVAKRFDAEAALVAMQESIARRQHGPTPATRYEVYTAIQDGLAAGRGVTRG